MPTVLRTKGRGWARREDARLVRGLGRFVDDDQSDRHLHLRIVRSPYAHARVLSIDTSEALAVDGVVCVLTGHALKDPTITVAYHSADPKTFEEVLGQKGVRRASFANRAVQVPNDLDEIVKAIEVYA